MDMVLGFVVVMALGVLGVAGIRRLIRAREGETLQFSAHLMEVPEPLPKTRPKLVLALRRFFSCIPLSKLGQPVPVNELKSLLLAHFAVDSAPELTIAPAQFWESGASSEGGIFFLRALASEETLRVDVYARPEYEAKVADFSPGNGERLPPEGTEHPAKMVFRGGQRVENAADYCVAVFRRVLSGDERVRLSVGE